MTKNLLSPKNDVVFQNLFGRNEHKEILISFLNAILTSSEEGKIKDVVINEKKISVSTLLDEKISILDIYVTTDKNTHINVEMQLINEYNIIKRSLFYWSKMYLNQINTGDKYKLLNKTITINLLDFNFIKDDKFHNVYHLTEDETKEQLTDVMEINFIELKKFRDSIKDKDNKLHKWLSFIINPGGKDVENIIMVDEDLKKAREILSSISADEETRQLAEMRDKAIMDRISQIEGAKEEAAKVGREEGLKEGLKEGEKKKAAEIAKNLLDVLDDNTISIKTGLTLDEIVKLRN